MAKLQSLNQATNQQTNDQIDKYIHRNWHKSGNDWKPLRCKKNHWNIKLPLGLGLMIGY